MISILTLETLFYKIFIRISRNIVTCNLNFYFGYDSYKGFVLFLNDFFLFYVVFWSLVGLEI